MKKLEPKDAPLVHLMRDSKTVKTDAPKWIDDDLHPVHFGPYTIIGHHRDADGTHHLAIRDNERGVDIYLTGEEE